MDLWVSAPDSFLAFIAALVPAFFLGALWFGPLFGKLWTRSLETKLNFQMSTQKFAGYMITTIWCNALALFVLLTIFKSCRVTALSTALEISFWCWLGLQFTHHLNSDMWANRRWPLLFIDTVYGLATWLVMVVTYWLVKPYCT